jgi:hypothetical protein
MSCRKLSLAESKINLESGREKNGERQGKKTEGGREKDREWQRKICRAAEKKRRAAE